MKKKKQLKKSIVITIENRQNFDDEYSSLLKIKDNMF